MHEVTIMRRERKKDGLCIWCGKKPAYKWGCCKEHILHAKALRCRFLLTNPTYCEEYYDKHRSEFYFRNNSRRARLKALGLCVDCGQFNDNQPHIRCAECLAKQRESIRKWREKRKAK